MARSRNLKPSFFLDDELADLPPLVRILFQGLWCISDRDGRCEYRPKRIKAQILPYDQIDIVDALSMLANGGFVVIYKTDESATEWQYIQVLNFARHQHPHSKEQASTIQAPDLSGANPSLTLNPITLTLNPITTSKPRRTAARFDDFWFEYPKKVERKKALAKWKARNLDSKADEIIADVINRKTNDGKWLPNDKGETFIPNPTTYINGDRWDDELQPAHKPSNGTLSDEYERRAKRTDEIISKFNAGTVAVDGETISPAMDEEQWRDRRPAVPRLDG